MRRKSRVEAENQKCEPDYGQAGAISRDCVNREKHTGDKKGRTEILLQKEEDQRCRDSRNYRQKVVQTRDVKPRRDAVITNSVAIDLPQQFPLACKVAGQEQG